MNTNNGASSSSPHKRKRQTVSLSSQLVNGMEASMSTGTDGHDERRYTTRDHASEPPATSQGAFWNEVKPQADASISLDPALEDVKDQQDMEVTNTNGGTLGSRKDEDRPPDMTDSHEEHIDSPPLEMQVEPFDFEELPGHAIYMKSYRCRRDDELGRGNWMHTLNVTCTRKGKVVGIGRGIYVKRDVVRSNFWQTLQDLRPDLSSIAFELFDRYGRLNEQFISHPICKGKGCWGSELDFGDLFIIEYVSVLKRFRRKGIGGAILETLLEKTCSGERNAAFSIARPGLLPLDVEEALRGEPRRETTQEGHRYSHVLETTALFRSYGFRRIGASRCLGLATDHSHTARSIPKHRDLDVPFSSPETELTETENGDGGVEIRERILRKLEKESELRHAIFSSPDQHCVEMFKSYYSQTELRDKFETIDQYGNNLVHLAVVFVKPRSIQWLLENVDEGQKLSLGRTREGFTPLELLKYRLEIVRNFQRQPNSSRRVISDSFSGYDDDTILSMTLLYGIRPLTSLQILRFKYGCTCDQCISGFLSPRMKFALSRQAAATHTMLFNHLADAERWCNLHQRLIQHVAPNIREMLYTDVDMREGFGSLFGDAGTVLRLDKALTVDNFTRECNESISPLAKIFLDRGGTVESALRIMFENARDRDEWAGDGGHMENFRDEIEAKARCRNDHEFGFVALACGIAGLNEN